MNLEEILTLMDSFNQTSLTELRFEQDETRIVLKRQKEQNPVYTQPMVVHPQALAAPAAVATQTGDIAPGANPAGGAAPQGSAAEGGAAPDAPAAGVEVITSPIVGTFYRSASPDSPPFVEEGDVIEKGKTLCILEAMKVMNELEAEFTMEIVAIKVPNGDMVEYGTPLLEVRRV